MAMTIQELREKRAKAWDTARDFLDSKRNANGVLSEEDSKTYDAMEKTIVDLGKEIQRLERQAEIEKILYKYSMPHYGIDTSLDVVRAEFEEVIAFFTLFQTENLFHCVIAAHIKQVAKHTFSLSCRSDKCLHTGRWSFCNIWTRRMWR